MQDSSYTHFTLIFLLLLVIVNLFLLDLKIFSPASSIKLSDISTVTTPMPSPSLISNSGFKNDNLSCPDSCLSAIQQATKSDSLAIGAPTQDVASTQPIIIQPKYYQEFYIPLGSGSTQKSNWEDVVATETIIDTANYGTIKEAYFIASLRNPTQNGHIEAQLFNVTDKHPVWESQVIMNGPLSQTITSEKITLETGNKLYRVQLKSSLSALVYLDNAKIKIITE